MKTLLACLLGLAILPAGRLIADDAVDYARDVKPILVQNCVKCHGAVEPKVGLRLDSAAAVLKGGDSGPVVVPGQPEESELLLAVLGQGFGERMPLKRDPLPEKQIETLRAWIVAGAPVPTDERQADASHWAFQPVERAEVPAVENAAWVRNPIDVFILKRLEDEGLAPSPEADRATLIRRASLDLTGLPPTPEEVAAFLADDQPEAYERLIDRLLASPHYGERWARHWLDMARYADSNGYSIDAPRSIWLYRDWVIDALNRDMPFDRFAIEQLAGDLLPEATLDQKVATGFHRNTPINQEGGIDKEQFRVESVIDRVNTTASVFLGLTLGCCQCHDHKYDPFTQKEYYQMFAFFNNVDEPEIPVATPEIVAEREAIDGQIEAYLAKIQEEDPSLLEKQKAWETSLTAEERQKQSQDVRESFDTPFDQRDKAKNAVVFAAFIDQSPETKEHKTVISDLRKQMPKINTTMVVRERVKNPRQTHILQGGDFTRPGDPVAPGVPAVLPVLETSGSESASRLDLARWLVSAENPLTARVTVNRVWQRYFGRGLVETENDFGLQGARPTHPELLDWLASEFVRQGWSLKPLHRLIVTSATYRQASTLRPDLAEHDPNNYLLARQSRLRLDAEVIRDTALEVSGLLSPEVGGPSVFPPQPDGVMNLGQMRRAWTADKGPDRYRRGLYTYFWRATPHPLLMVFDAPDSTRACTRRVRSNTPLQALMLLNDEAFFEFARALADRVLTQGPEDADARLSYAFRLALARDPSEAERDRLRELLDALTSEGEDPHDGLDDRGAGASESR